jgi:hypothetical protein
VRRLRGRRDVGALRRDPSGPGRGARRHRRVRATDADGGLRDRREAVRVHAGGVGPARRAAVRRRPRALPRGGRGGDPLVRLLPRPRWQPGRGAAHHADEPRDRRATWAT